jgi:hypothetical protein
MIKFGASLATLFSLVNGQTAEEEARYPLFAAQMKEWGYTWDPLTVTTEDGYILTTFHVTGKVGHEITKKEYPPVMLMHGLACDATSWLGIGGDRVNAPLPL